MKITSNVQERPIFVTNTFHVFSVGNRVRVQLYPKKEKEYPYSGSGIIGKIKDIFHNGFIIENSIIAKPIMFEDIFIIRNADENESFDNTPYINDEERAFWCTHWITKNGIKEKTAEDLEMLKNFKINLLTPYKI